MAVFLHIFALAALLAPVPAVQVYAPAADTVTAAPLRADTVTLPNVRVEAARLRTSALATPARVERLERESIEASAARSAADLLSMRTGAWVRRYGAGGLATVSLRGTSAAQTLVLLDGQRVADPQSGQVDLTLLPTLLLQSVEVQSGAASARYGAGGLGGVVRLRTLQPSGRLGGRAIAEAGAFGERRAGAVVRGGSDRLSLLAAAEATHADGDFPYVNEALFPRQEVRRAGAGRTSATAFGAARYAAGRHRLRASLWLSEAARGLPGPSNEAATGAHQEDVHRRLALQSRSRMGWGTLHLQAEAQATALRYADPAAPSVGDTARTQRYALRAEATAPLAPRWLVTAGAEAGLDRAALRGGLQRTHAAAFIDAEAAYGRLALYPALRLDGYASAEASAEAARSTLALSPRLGLTVQPLAWGGLRLKARLARAFRAPTFGERFYRPGGNPDLRAEHGWSAETGAALLIGWTRARLSAEATAFALRFTDQIVWQPSYAGAGVQVWRPRNVGRVQTRGLELSLGGALRPRGAVLLDGGLTFTHTAAEDRSDAASAAFGRQLRYVPREQLKAHLGLTRERLPLVGGRLRLDVGARLVSRRYTTSDETRHLPPYGVLDAQARYTWRVGGALQATLGLVAENLADARYAVIRRYPMPPRHARLRLVLETLR